MLTFEKQNLRGHLVQVSVSPTTGFTYEVHNKWNTPRGQGYAVFIRDCATGKSISGNKSAFHTNNTDPQEAYVFCENHNKQMNDA